jgi:ATP synthase subunit 6
MRWILALAIVAAACFVSHEYSAHRSGANIFETLYFHLVPAPLVVSDTHADEHGVDEHGVDEHANEAGEHADEDHGAGGTEAVHDEAGDDHHHPTRPLFEFELPSFLAFMDYRGETDADSPKSVLFNLQVFQVASLFLCLILFWGVPRYIRTGKGDLASRIFAGWAMWIRDEMVYPVMGKETGRKFLPYFLSVFFFIVFMNLMGLMPFSATPTASIFVTAGLALTTLFAMVGCGMVMQGPWAFWKNLVPHVPPVMLIIMVPVELVGLLVKPFALMIRLFANMAGGHMVVLSFMGLIYFMATLWGPAGGWGTAPIGVGFAVFIMIIEAFVALLQAFIFTQLSIIFVGASVHPEH